MTVKKMLNLTRFFYLNIKIFLKHHISYQLDKSFRLVYELIKNPYFCYVRIPAYGRN
jgi:hypothetical protein